MKPLLAGSSRIIFEALHPKNNADATEDAMLFTTIDFAIFLPLVFALYWGVTQRNLRLQNALIVVASYVFYGWWDWRFLSLLLISTVVDFSVGLALNRIEKPSKRKLFLAFSMALNLGFLGIFKYYNFFLENLLTAFSFFGKPIQISSLNIILPVGISFYTFQTMSYCIDIYQRKLEPTRSIIDFAAFVSFFPQLVAGPIERATNLLPQFQKQRKFEYAEAVNGMRQILWGLFKKLVIANNCAEYANLIFSNPDAYNGSALFMGAFFFTFQIYGDFSGYSDIAIGTARLFGFKLMQNFAFPYFSRDMAEFWRRWHISLSTWFRDYVYIPLGGSRGSRWMQVRNILVVFLLSGFWHGARWTFIVWGLLNALYFMPLLLAGKNRNHLEVVAAHRVLPSLRELGAMTLTFLLTVLAWIFFRADTLEQAGYFISKICSSSFLQIPNLPMVQELPGTGWLLVGFLLVEWAGRRDRYALETLGNRWPKILRWTFYSFIIFLLAMFTPTVQTPFIYFNF